MRRHAAILVGLLVGLMSNQASAKDVEALFGPKYAIAKTLNDFIPVGGPGYRVQLDVANPGMGQFRLVFDNIVAGSSAFTLQVITPEKTYTISSSALTQASTYETEIYVGKPVSIRLIAASPPVGLSFRVAELVYENAPGGLLSVVGPDGRVPIDSLAVTDPKRLHSRPVAKIVFRSRLDGEEYLCTGFLVAKSVLLTNNHCLGTGEDQAHPDDPAYRCATATAIFGYLSDSDMTNSNAEQFSCAKVVDHNFERDYALVQLTKDAGSKWGILKLAKATPGPGTALYIPQHPSGLPQKISVDGCTLETPAVLGNPPADKDAPSRKVDFSNTCDTEPGASGSPVLDAATNEVVGLHHLGFDPSVPEFRGVNRAVRAEELKSVSDAIAP